MAVKSRLVFIDFIDRNFLLEYSYVRNDSIPGYPAGTGSTGLAIFGGIKHRAKVRRQSTNTRGALFMPKGTDEEKRFHGQSTANTPGFSTSTELLLTT